LGRELNWFEAMPLFGRRIVITRAAHDASDFAARIRALGGEAIEFPAIETAPPSSYDVLDRAIAEIGSFDWIIFSSANGVDHFVDRMRTNGHDLRELGRAAIAAIGPITANRVRRYALTVAAMRAEVAREVLPEMLRQHGAREVVVAPTYRTIIPAGTAADATRMRALIAAGLIDLVTFTSSSTVTNYAAMAAVPVAGLKAAAIGPITAETARGLGFDVVAAPASYTVEALIAAIAEYYA
jgi:uroporphyrinogen III methyltransferase/synthase